MSVSAVSAAVARGWRKGARTLIQLAAGGALTGLVAVIAGGLSPTIQALLMAAWTALVAAAQNGLEAAGKIPTLLPTAPIGPVTTGGGVTGVNQADLIPPPT